jgi:hypothetical protein
MTTIQHTLVLIIFALAGLAAMAAILNSFISRLERVIEILQLTINPQIDCREKIGNTVTCGGCGASVDTIDSFNIVDHNCPALKLDLDKITINAQGQKANNG